MKIRALIISLLIILSITTACAFGKKKTSTTTPATPPVQNRIVVSKSQDEVWKSILELFEQDLGYPVDKADTKKGVIETQWISIITVDGTSRWKLVASVKKSKAGTEIALEKKVQLLEKPNPKDKDKKKDREPEPGKSLGGWRTGKSDIADEGQVMASLKKKLGL